LKNNRKHFFSRG